MLVLNNGLLYATKGFAIALLVAVVFFCSCNNKFQTESKQEPAVNIQAQAIKCVLENHYKHSSKRNRNELPAVLVSSESVYFKTALGRISDSCPFCKGKIADTVLVKSLPKMKIANKSELTTLDNNKDRRNYNGEVWVFTPLFATETKDYFTVLSEKSNYESREVFIHLLRKKKNGNFEYLFPINGFIVFY